MTCEADNYYARFASAFVRGTIGASSDAAIHGLVDLPLSSLSQTDMSCLMDYGLRQGLRLHRFKRTRQLPRVKHVPGSNTSVKLVGSGIF